MKPEPWGEALDQLVAPESADHGGLHHPQRDAVHPGRGPGARRPDEHLVFACGRYEGIDQRVIDHAGERAQVREISLGDYVLNGGEVAALAITEAVVRLLPGFMGNPESLAEESHEDGLLEYPVYTKPQSWRGHEVPPVLLSGNHAAIADWRHDQAMRRTAERRPDLLHASSVVDGWEMVRRPPQRRARALDACSWPAGPARRRPPRTTASRSRRARGARGRGGVAVLLGHLRGRAGGPAGRLGPGSSGGRGVGGEPADGGAGPARTGAWVGCCSSTSQRVAAPDGARSARLLTGRSARATCAVPQGGFRLAGVGDGRGGPRGPRPRISRRLTRAVADLAAGQSVEG